MKTITIRLEDDVFNNIEQRRGKKSKSDFYREIIERSMNINEDDLNNPEYEKLQNEYEKNQVEYDKLQSEYRSLQSEHESLRTDSQKREAIEKIQYERIRDLQNQVGFLQLEFSKLNDRLLLPPQKKWWEVWK